VSFLFNDLPSRPSGIELAFGVSVEDMLTFQGPWCLGEFAEGSAEVPLSRIVEHHDYTTELWMPMMEL
jgi:hypothetical protein